MVVVSNILRLNLFSYYSYTLKTHKLGMEGKELAILMTLYVPGTVRGTLLVLSCEAQQVWVVALPWIYYFSSDMSSGLSISLIKKYLRILVALFSSFVIC